MRQSLSGEFDAPLLALLEANGFTDIHHLHGAFEFGKDAIAKRVDGDETRQYALQSKAGDLGLSDWRKVRLQLEEARLDGLAHPQFDRDLPRVAVLVVTGRLVGGAVLQAQDYRRRIEDRGEPGFEVWDRETLRPWLAAHPACGLGGGSPGDLLALIGVIDQKRADHEQVERYARRWASVPLQRVAIESAVLANRLRNAGRADLAAIVALGGLRAAMAQPAEPGSASLAEATRRLHGFYAVGLLGRYEHVAADPRALLNETKPEFMHITYPVTCLRLAEIWGLLALAPHIDADLVRRAEHAVVQLLCHQPGAAHPVSDRWAVSLISAAMALARIDIAAADTFLRKIIIWVADAYDHGFGLAGADTALEEEAAYLLGPELEHVNKPKRRASYLATVIIDLLAALGLAETYEFALNELLAVNAQPTVLVADESRALWGVTRGDLHVTPQVSYREPWRTDLHVAAHHAQAATPGVAPWDALALATLPRNRHPYWALLHYSPRSDLV